MLTFKNIVLAETRIAHSLVRTPLLWSDRLNAHLPFDLYVKAENLQRTGSFKFRGASHVLACLEEAVRHVVAFSSGNHAQAVALAARLAGRHATIIMPKDAPETKIEGTRAFGAEIVLYDRYREDREAIAMAHAQKNHKNQTVLIPPYDDLGIIAGQGTAGLEIARQAQEQQITPDYYVCCCGGGGLLAGSALAIKQTFPDTMIYAAEPEGFDDMARSIAVGERQRNAAGARSICDAIVTPMPGELTFPLIQNNVTAGMAVSDAAVLSAMRVAWDYFKLVVEPGGAVALAAVLQDEFVKKVTRDRAHDQAHDRGRDRAHDRARQTVMVMLSGGNCAPKIFQQALATSPAFG